VTEIVESTDNIGASTDVDRMFDTVTFDEAVIDMAPRSDATATKFARFGVHVNALAFPKQFSAEKNGVSCRKNVLLDELVSAYTAQL
jgi:hypothetical protein